MSVGSVMVAGDERSDCYCCWDMRNMKVMVDFDVGGCGDEYKTKT